MTPPRNSTLVTLLLASTLVVMAGAVLAPVLEVMRGDLGISGTAAGLIITVHAMAIAVVSPFIGWLIDRWGVRAPLAAGLALYGLAGGAALFISSYPALLVDRVIFGIGSAAIFGGTTVAMLTLYDGPERDRVIGWRGTATSLGGVLWPLLGGAVGGISWHAPFAIYLIGVPLALATLVSMPARSASPVRGSSRPETKGILRLVRLRPALLGFCGLQITGSILLYTQLVFLPQRLAQIGIDEPFIVAAYTATISGVMSLVGLGYARMRIHLGYAPLLRLSAASWMAAFLILATVSQPVLLALAPALFGLGMGIVFPATTVLIGEVSPLELRGQATSLSATATFAGQFFSPLLIGPLVVATSITTGFLASTGIAALALIVLFVTKVSSPAENKIPAEEPQPVSR